MKIYLLVLILLISGCGIFDGPEVQKNLYNSLEEIKTVCNEVPGKIVYACMELNTDPCVIHALKGDEGNIKHEIAHCTDGLYHD